MTGFEAKDLAFRKMFPMKNKALILLMDIHIVGQAQNIIRADLVKQAEGLQMMDGQLVDAFFISGIHLLGGLKNRRDIRLFQIAVFPKFTNNFPVHFHAVPPHFL